MARWDYDTKLLPINNEIGAVFGHLVLCNNQIHDFQEKTIKDYFNRKGIPFDYFRDVIFFKENAVSEKEAIELLKKEADEIKKEFFFYLMLVSEIDGYTDCEEEDFFKRLLKEIKINNASVIADCAKEAAIKERKRFKKHNAVGNTGRRANPKSTNNIFRITQKDYLEAIEKCQKAAKKDYDLVFPVTEDIINSGEKLHNELAKKINSNPDFRPEITNALTEFSDCVDNMLISHTEKYRDEMKRKGCAINDFTISLIGRTKAGKSTLRAVLTGEGEENIGIGAQRTTRINSIYEWNHMRIIDTPGIDAGADSEEQDQKIAEQVIGESDVICYIAASDGLPESARNFAVNIAKRNKPVLMLVNYKSNIKSPARFRRYIENPNQWKNSEGANNIEGYYKPIKRLAEENSVDSLISYNTVFLYAELLGKREEYKEYSRVLRASSGVNEFLANLKNSVVNQGPFLRSKTVIDDTATICNQWITTLDDITKPLRNHYDDLINESAETKGKIRKTQQYLIKSVESDVSLAYDKLAKNDAVDFANMHYMEKSNLSSKWGKFVKDTGFYDSIESAVAERYKSFEEEITSIMNEVLEDLKIGVYESNASFNKISGLSFPFRELFRYTGDLIALAGSIFLIVASLSNPVGWILTAAGVVINLFSKLFKSKAKRESEAKRKLLNSITASIENQKASSIETIIKQVRKESDKCVDEVINRFESLINGLQMILDICDDMASEMNNDVDQLNILFAQRIMEYIGGSKCEISNVERTPGNEFRIYPVKYVDTENLQLDKLNGLINEKVVIINT